MHESDEVYVAAHNIHDVHEIVGEYRDKVLKCGCVEEVEKDRQEDE